MQMKNTGTLHWMPSKPLLERTPLKCPAQFLTAKPSLNKLLKVPSDNLPDDTILMVIDIHFNASKVLSSHSRTVSVSS